MKNPNIFKILYFNVIAPELYDVIRSLAPQGFEVIFLDKGDEMERLKKLEDADYMLIADATLTKAHVQAAPRLRMVQHQGVGYEKVDLKALAKAGIPLGITPEGTTVGVAEHTILLILALYRRLPTAHQSLLEGKWLQWELRTQSFELSGKTLGILGMGRIGQAVASRIKNFGVHILYYDKYLRLSDSEEKELQSRFCSFEELLSTSDIISLHVLLSNETRHFIGRDQLKMMKKSAVLINTCRGQVIEEQALYEALKNKDIAGAALDVFYKEPPDPNNPLFKLDNVVLTPHIAAGTIDGFKTKISAAFANIVRHAEGKPILNQVKDVIH
jgi:phosphoglycerate dehydrogenase-like enzyme